MAVVGASNGNWHGGVVGDFARGRIEYGLVLETEGNHVCTASLVYWLPWSEL